MGTYSYSVTSSVTKEIAECDREYTSELNIPTNKTPEHSDNYGTSEGMR